MAATRAAWLPSSPTRLRRRSGTSRACCACDSAGQWLWDVLAAAGTARPQRFFDMLAACGIDVRPLALPDHYDYASLPWPADTPDVVVTEKDAVKLDPARISTTRVWVAPLDFEIGLAFES